MGRKEKARGNRLERVVAKALSSGLGLPFVRTPNSGAWGKAHTNGDVVCLVHESAWHFPFTVECKKTKRVQLELLLTDQLWAKFDDWWKQTVDAAEEEGNEPMLVMSHNQGPLIVVFKHRWTHSVMTRIKLVRREEGTWFITTLPEFIRTYSLMIPEDLKERYAEEAAKYC